MTEILTSLGASTQPQFWVAVLEIIWINILLSGDNAIVIALACRRLPPKQRVAGIVLGTVAALVMRVAFASIVVTLMFIPYVKIAGGLALLWIAMKLLVPSEESGEAASPTDTLLRAMAVIAVADIVMSLDNVIAVAAAADGNFALLVFGLGISVPAVVGGATVISALINYFPLVVWAGAALLGWIAGDVIAGDPVVADAAHALGAGAHEKIKLACAILGASSTVVAGVIGRARLARRMASRPAE
jgi:YjbE family integral membrane protein